MVTTDESYGMAGKIRASPLAPFLAMNGSGVSGASDPVFFFGLNISCRYLFLRLSIRNGMVGYELRQKIAYVTFVQ